MLTIGQVAAHAGTTVRAVRFYHQQGLLPEPLRDASGYRRYDAAAVVELIRIRTLADAGVPLARVGELLAAGPAEFATALEDIDHRLRADIRKLQGHRRRIRELGAGDTLALPPEAVSYLDRLRALGMPERMIGLERDAWIVIAAQLPEQMPALMTLKRAQLDTPEVLALYHDLLETVDWAPDDPRVPEVADRLASYLEAEAASADWEANGGEFDLDDDVVDLLDSVFIEALPIARQLLRHLENRGWTGWTRLRRIDVPDR